MIAVGCLYFCNSDRCNVARHVRNRCLLLHVYRWSYCDCTYNVRTHNVGVHHVRLAHALVSAFELPARCLWESVNLHVNGTVSTKYVFTCITCTCRHIVDYLVVSFLPNKGYLSSFSCRCLVTLVKAFIERWVESTANTSQAYTWWAFLVTDCMYMYVHTHCVYV